MPFDQSAITDVSVRVRDAELVVSWASSAPATVFYHVYLDRVHVWTGKAKSAVVPHPAAGRRVTVEVGTVLASERHLDLSGQLPAAPGGGSRLTLNWTGGTFLSPDIARYDVYLGLTPGGAVSYAAPVGSVAAYSQGTGPTDGWGMGRFGYGGFGLSSASYEWSIGGLPSGAWNAAVVPVDNSGNPGTAATTSGTVTGPPWPPARDAAGKRVTYTIQTEDEGGFGAGPFGAGGFGSGADGFGLGGFGGGGWGSGGGALWTYATLNWAASPGS